MLKIHDNRGRLCDGVSRREVLRIGGLGAVGLSLPSLLRASTPQGRSRAKSCIMLFMLGGPPQHETWDPKPEAPVEVRGDLRPIPSRVPGVWVGELMPRTARLMDKIAVLRAMSTGDHAHSTSGYAMCTGVPHSPLGVEGALPGPPNDWPHIGSVLAHLRQGTRVTALPQAVTLHDHLHNDNGATWPGQDAGFLGRAADPWFLRGDPASEAFEVRDLTLPPGVPPMRFDDRRGLLSQLDSRLAAAERSGVFDRMDHWNQRAFELVSSPAARAAFDLSREPAEVRDRYGRHTFGQSCLLARRLVEAGVGLVQVTWPRTKGALSNGHWDTHLKNTEALKTTLMPPMDQSYSALLEDLGSRGLLDETLVVWMGEFGRTPRVNPNGGRDHWGTVFSVALAGGGVRGGVVHGASDRLGAEPLEGRVSPADLAATVFHCLGYAPETEIHDRAGRPLPISRGRVVREIL